ncbi:MAG: hypothetical protein ACJA16_000442 [Akkermansiaceae bacterium]
MFGDREPFASSYDWFHVSTHLRVALKSLLTTKSASSISGESHLPCLNLVSR